MSDSLDMMDIMGLLADKKDIYIKEWLHDLEILYKDSDPSYYEVRKLILDYFNGYFRSVCRVLVGGKVE